MLAFIQSNPRSGVRTTMQSLVKFERKPYGWYLAAIQCTAAKLYARGKVEFAQRQQPAGRRRPGARPAQHPRPRQPDPGPADRVHGRPGAPAQGVLRRFLRRAAPASEAKALGKETAAAFRNMAQELELLRNLATRYPFLSALKRPIDDLQPLIGKPYTFYLTELRQQENRLLDLKEGVIDPVRRFMSGSQRTIYDEARDFLLIQEPNLSYVDGGEAQEMRVILVDPACYQGNTMTRLKSLADGLRRQVVARVQQEKERAGLAVEDRRQRLAALPEFKALTTDQQAVLRQPFDELARTLQVQTLIAVIRDELRRFEQERYPQLLSLMTDWLEPEPETEAGRRRDHR